jgi:predicted ATPase/DNA-binding CsgD family transcriptional regulator
VIGRAYAAETGIPYALFADAFLPLIRSLDTGALNVLTRGGSGELAYLFPSLGSDADRARVAAGSDSAELKARLQWNFTQFLAKLSAKQPLCIVLENLQWADASSLELLHFVARQISTEPIAILASYNDAERDLNPGLGTMERSLIGLGVAKQRKLSPLSQDAVRELLERRFGTEATAFGTRLYEWTRGNPFFIEETLKWLVETGELKNESGVWIGWEMESLQLPPNVRDTVKSRIDRLGANARKVADVASVIGTRLTFDAIAALTQLDEKSVAEAIDELCAHRILEETAASDEQAYDFAHPILQQVTYKSLGGGQVRLMHGHVAEKLEEYYGENAAAHAGELAFHFSRSGTLAPKAVKYLREAGRTALDTYANREAAGFLAAALQQADALTGDASGRDEIVRNLARAKQRLGEYDEALALWSSARSLAAVSNDRAALASIDYRMGLASFWSGRFEDALTYYERGLEAAVTTSDSTIAVRLYLAKAICLQELGQMDAAKVEAEKALKSAEEAGSDSLLARAHRALLILYSWTGPSSVALEHGKKALAFSEASGEKMLEWTAHWGLGILSGLTGNAREFIDHIHECNRLEQRLRSPLLPIWTAELSLQYSSWVGEWDEGIATGERTILLARSLNQRTLLPRLLVWTGLIYLWRHDLERARAYFDEAWGLSGAGSASARHLDLQTVVPAHMGLAAYHLETENLDEAIRLGEAALELADNRGYIAWSLQWVLPIVGEAALWNRDFERAKKHCVRMRLDGQRLGNPIAVAMADFGDGMLSLLRDGNPPAAIPLLQSAIAALDEIPLPDQSSRMRRALSQAFKENGDREAALHELRIAHETFARLGAAGGLETVREEIRKLGSRPPPRIAAAGMAGLTGREIEIARMVAMRKSNKDIGAALDISARTVSTHLSNIFGKLGVSSRGELADYVRERSLD